MSPVTVAVELALAGSVKAMPGAALKLLMLDVDAATYVRKKPKVNMSVYRCVQNKREAEKAVIQPHSCERARPHSCEWAGEGWRAARREAGMLGGLLTCQRCTR